ncbi:DUF4224 domain-containing protein [Ralstonia solanacearum]|uniref:DUF4224 domain-containing protein n=1 Tax=Ralstonia solanacearum TaxID=305 RepID=UPI0009BDD83A|nr:DUF4224 domain-containing protein [Ralstonia solanacearum]
MSGHLFDNRLMNEKDLHDVTGLKRHSAQVNWFVTQFGVKPVQRADGRVILSWAAFEALQARRVCATSAVPATNNERPTLVPVRRAA